MFNVMLFEQYTWQENVIGRIEVFGALLSLVISEGFIENVNLDTRFIPCLLEDVK